MLKSGVYYNLLVTVNGTTATLVVDGTSAFTYTFGARVIDDVRYGLNKGLVGMGSDNARGMFDNVKVQILPPAVTYDVADDQTKTAGQLVDAVSGTWVRGTSGLTGTASSTTPASTQARFGSVTRLGSTSWVEITTTVRTAGVAGVCSTPTARTATRWP